MTNYSFYIYLLLACGALLDAADERYLLENVSLRVYNRNGSHEDVLLTDASRLTSLLNRQEPVTIYIHSSYDGIDTDHTKAITNALLNYTNVNVLAVNYERVAQLFYPLVPQQIQIIGRMVAQALDTSGVNPQNVHIIGHAVGAQMAGVIGRNVNAKISRISGLDPAGPAYYIMNTPLNSADADFVDMIYTDGGIYGNIFATGTVNFYPNFGHRPQPGCKFLERSISPRDACSHFRALAYYIESISNENAFVGVQCVDGVAYALQLCNNDEQIVMGYYTPNTATGKVFLTTNAEAPYGLGTDGAEFNSTSFMRLTGNLISSVLP